MKEEVLLDGEIKETHESKFLVQYKTLKGKTEKSTSLRKIFGILILK